MISLEQIRLLESRVMKAVRRIETLQSENDTLRERLERYEKRIQELEVLINEFKDGQSEIEQGIMNALSQLDNLEDQVTDSEMQPGPDRQSGAGTQSGTAPESGGGSRSGAGTQSGAAPGAGSESGAGTSQNRNESPDGGSQDTPARPEQAPEAATKQDLSRETNTGESRSHEGVPDDEHETDTESEQGAELDIF